MDQYLLYTIFRGMNTHLPAILMFTRGTRFWHTAMWFFRMTKSKKRSCCTNEFDSTSLDTRVGSSFARAQGPCWSLQKSVHVCCIIYGIIYNSIILYIYTYYTSIYKYIYIFIIYKKYIYYIYIHNNVSWISLHFWDTFCSKKHKDLTLK